MDEVNAQKFAESQAVWDGKSFCFAKVKQDIDHL